VKVYRKHSSCGVGWTAERRKKEFAGKTARGGDDAPVTKTNKKQTKKKPPQKNVQPRGKEGVKLDMLGAKNFGRERSVKPVGLISA